MCCGVFTPQCVLSLCTVVTPHFAKCAIWCQNTAHCTTRKTRLKTPQNTFCTQNTFENTAKHVLCAHCDTLKHTATHCSTLQHTATHCNTLQHTFCIVYCLGPTVCTVSMSRHRAMHCNTLQHTASQNL